MWPFYVSGFLFLYDTSGIQCRKKKINTEEQKEEKKLPVISL